jgi:hypothetical protein
MIRVHSPDDVQVHVPVAERTSRTARACSPSFICGVACAERTNGLESVTEQTVPCPLPRLNSFEIKFPVTEKRTNSNTNNTDKHFQQN